MSENEIVNQIHLYEYMLKSHELNCEGIVALKMHVCKLKYVQMYKHMYCSFIDH